MTYDFCHTLQSRERSILGPSPVDLCIPCSQAIMIFHQNLVLSATTFLLVIAQETTTASSIQDCASSYYPAFWGDNFCDDGLNTAECEWDGGDCCGDDVIKTYCSECQCLDPVETTTTEATTPEDEATEDSCTPAQFWGDNVCNDNLNTAECEWDGGDCCGDDVIKKHCSQCQCLDPNAMTTTTTTEILPWIKEIPENIRLQPSQTIIKSHLSVRNSWAGKLKTISILTVTMEDVSLTFATWIVVPVGVNIFTVSERKCSTWKLCLC